MTLKNYEAGWTAAFLYFADLNPNNSRPRGRQGRHSVRTLHQSPLTTTWSQQGDFFDYEHSATPGRVVFRKEDLRIVVLSFLCGAFSHTTTTIS